MSEVEITEFQSILLHARRFKESVKELTTQQLIEVQEKLNAIVEDRKAADEALKEQEQAKLAQIEQLKSLIEEAGLSLDDLSSTPIKRERQPKPPKYAITVDGEQVTWTGQGRMPKPIKAAIDNGASLESFLIK